MNKTTINLTVGFIMVCISLTIIPFSSINAQTMIPNELQQKYPQPYGMSTQDYMYMMQMMQFYMNMFGPQWQDQVIKIYEDDDDDDDDDDDHDHDNDKKDRGDWKKWFKKHYDKDRDDKKKYCEGKGSWNGHKCVTNNEKDRADWEDAVCDNKPGSNSKLCGKDDKKEDDEKELEEPEFSFISDENENNEVEEQEGSEESEPEEKEEQEEESKDDDGSEDSGGDDSSDDDGGGDSDDDGGDSDDGGDDGGEEN